MFELSLFVDGFAADLTSDAIQAPQASSAAPARGPDPLEQAFLALQQLGAC